MPELYTRYSGIDQTEYVQLEIITEEILERRKHSFHFRNSFKIFEA
jgi:hypothetical protein